MVPCGVTDCVEGPSGRIGARVDGGDGGERERAQSGDIQGDGGGHAGAVIVGLRVADGVVGQQDRHRAVIVAHGERFERARVGVRHLQEWSRRAATETGAPIRNRSSS